MSIGELREGFEEIKMLVRWMLQYNNCSSILCCRLQSCRYGRSKKSLISIQFSFTFSFRSEFLIQCTKMCFKCYSFISHLVEKLQEKNRGKKKTQTWNLHLGVYTAISWCIWDSVLLWLLWHCTAICFCGLCPIFILHTIHFHISG